MSKLLALQISLALTIITVILFFYGAYLVDLGLIPIRAVFETIAVPLLGAIYFCWRGK